MSIYCQLYTDQIQKLSSLNKYINWYINICHSAATRSSHRSQAKKIVGYVEAHHIIPRSFKMGGEKDYNNLVYLSAREHFICHKLLVNAFKNTIYYYRSLLAIKRFCQSGKTKLRIINSKNFEFARCAIYENC